jgi:diguanylate cyclase (GGDEF)-like protein/PAS domain S-box-containing protein
MDLELLELLSSLVCLIKNDRIAFMNRAGIAMLGLGSSAQIEGSAFEDFVVDDYKFLFEAGWELLAEEEFIPLRLRHADETLFEAEMRVRDTGHDGILIEVRDISKFVKSAEALREREARLQGILHSVAEGIITINDDGRISSANPAAERMFGHPAGKLIGEELLVLMPEETRDRHQRFFDAYMSGLYPTMMSRMVEGAGLRADGHIFPMEISVSEVRQGRHRMFTAIVRDISERKEHQDRIKRLAHHDSLTGLPNRNLLNDRMNHALARARRHGGRMAVLYVDLDKFKPINDTLGHEAGDAVLVEVAKRLTSCIRSSDTVARVGGDEFVVVVEEIGVPAEAALVARKIIDTLAKPIDYQGHACRIGASIGGAVFPDDGNSMDEVSKAADIAMYRVKRAGRNDFRFFSHEEA